MKMEEGWHDTSLGYQVFSELEIASYSPSAIDVKKEDNKKRGAHVWHAWLDVFASCFFSSQGVPHVLLHMPPTFTIICMHICTYVHIDLLYLTLAPSASFLYNQVRRSTETWTRRYRKQYSALFLNSNMYPSTLCLGEGRAEQADNSASRWISVDH